MKKERIIILLGPPGSGKGTQAKLLVKKFDLEYFGSGISLRKRKKIDDFTGRKLGKVMGKGELVPSFIISKLWIDRLEKIKQKKQSKGFVIDGSPRKMLEARLLDDALKWYEWEAKILFIDISKRESINRLTKRKMCAKCGRIIPWVLHFKKLKKCDKCSGPLMVRHDDSKKAINKRLDEFKDEVIKVIDYYKKQKRLIRINGEQSIEKVCKDILKAIK